MYMQAKQSKAKQSKGFTLVELSIVIVIIGLIVAGVVAGQSLVRQAKLQSLMGKVTKYETAYNTFMLTYGQKPGDMTDASSYWSGAENGNGNRVMDYAADADLNEIIPAWDHLKRAGLVTDVETRTQATVEGSIIALGGMWAGINVPSTGQKNYTGRPGAIAFVSGSFMIGGSRTNGYNMRALLTPSEASQWDVKVDDGRANTGRLQSFNGSEGGPLCRSGVDYDLTLTDQGCYLMYQLVK